MAARKSRTQRILDAVTHLASLGGLDAVSYRTVAQVAEVSHSAVHDRFPSRADLLRRSAARLAGQRQRALREQVRRAGIEGMVAETEEELFQSGAWLAFRACARIELAVAEEVRRARCAEVQLISSALGDLVEPGRRGAIATMLHLLLEQLEERRCDAVAPLDHADALAVLYAACDRLVEPGVSTTAAA